MAAGIKKKAEKVSTTEQKQKLKTSAFAKARPFLEQSKGEDGYIDPNVYLKLRSDYAEIIGNPSEFDDVFASYLSPQERARLGLGKAVGLKAIGTNIETNIDEESPY